MILLWLSATKDRDMDHGQGKFGILQKNMVEQEEKRVCGFFAFQTKHKSNAWYFDSKVSKHMTNRYNLFG